jgi:hypothetical protein
MNDYNDELELDAHELDLIVFGSEYFCFALWSQTHGDFAWKLGQESH